MFTHQAPGPEAGGATVLCPTPEQRHWSMLGARRLKKQIWKSPVGTWIQVMASTPKPNNAQKHKKTISADAPKNLAKPTINCCRKLPLRTLKRENQKLAGFLNSRAHPICWNLFQIRRERNASLPFSIRSELQLKRRSTYIKKGTLWTEFSIIFRTLTIGLALKFQNASYCWLLFSSRG